MSNGGNTYYWSGYSYSARLSGVAIFIASRLQSAVAEISHVDERKMWVTPMQIFRFKSSQYMLLPRWVSLKR